jgi:hypothetical protein
MKMQLFGGIEAVANRAFLLRAESSFPPLVKGGQGWADENAAFLGG